MDLRQIRYFITIAELGSFSKASQKLNVAQPALSRHVQNLEEEFGTRLLARTTRGVAPTEAGLVMMDRGVRLLREVVDLQDAVREASGGPSGEVTVGLPPSASTLVVRDLVAHCRESLPDVRLRIVEGVSMFLEEWLDRGGLDLAIVTDSASAQRFATTKLYSEEFLLVGDLAAVCPTCTSIAPQDLAAIDLVLTHGWRRLVTEQLGPEVVRCSAEVDSLPVIRSIVETGAAATVLPHQVIHRDGWSDRFRVLRFQGQPPHRAVVVAANPRRHHSAAVRAVRSAIISRVRSRAADPLPMRAPSAAAVA